MKLTSENYQKGFLLDEELMGGVTSQPEQGSEFVAYVLRHTTGEYLGYQPCAQLDEALALINQVKRDWKFESTSQCGSGKCGGCSKKGTSSCSKNLEKSLDAKAAGATCGSACSN